MAYVGKVRVEHERRHHIGIGCVDDELARLKGGSATISVLRSLE